MALKIASVTHMFSLCNRIQTRRDLLRMGYSICRAASFVEMKGYTYLYVCTNTHIYTYVQN